jgi:hypothetical protein
MLTILDNGEIFSRATAIETKAANHILHKFKPLIGCENPLKLGLGLLGVSHAQKTRLINLWDTDFSWQLGPQRVPWINQILGSPWEMVA